MATIDLKIDKMSCGACVRRVTQTLNAIPGTHAEEVSLGKARVQTETNSESLVAALTEAGFPAQVEATA
ncbi:MAG: cation transporter [Acidobacteriaceae bacterium]|nr:cation transporter [Acidobacteriaceae bacterium]